MNGQPYTTPADAIRVALEMNDFDKTVLNKGPVELKIIADFQEGGCRIFTLSLSKIHPAKDPGTKIVDYGMVSFALRVLADIKQVPVGDLLPALVFAPVLVSVVAAVT